MPSYPGFLGPTYVSSSSMSRERCINWFLEKNESPNAPTPYAMLPSPGVSVFASVSQAPIRGMFAQLGRAFFVAGFALYELFSNGTTIQRGTVNNDGKPVTFNANGDAGNQLWITSGGVGYVFDLATNTLSVQGVPGTTVSMGGYLSARFLYLDALTGAFYASALYDGTTWSGAMVAQSQSGDPWRALVVTPDGLIHLLGESSGEAWADQGASPFPYTKVAGADIAYGIVSPWAWAVDTQLTWIARNTHGLGPVVTAVGYMPTPISTHAIDTALGPVTDFSAVTAFNYSERGHAFFNLTVPSLDQTYTYDRKSGFWHERAYWNTSTGIWQAYRPGCMMSAFGQNLVGDRLTGDVYALSSALQSDVGGAAIRRLREPPRFSVQQKRVTVHSIQVVMDEGEGLSAGQGSDPVLMLQTSRNAGKTYGNERWSSVGAQGEYETRTIWDRCGASRNRADRFTATDPIPYRIVDCEIDYTVGLH